MAVPGASPSQSVSLSTYGKFALSGAICCAVTHGLMTPVDVVKTRIQLEPQVYNKGMVAGFRQVASAEGPGALLTGLGPTIAGYFLQGGLKFGGYEFWKKTIVDNVGYEKAKENRMAVYLTASAMCEFFADIALCPLEATRIRLVSQPTFANGLLGGFARIAKEEGLGGFYAGFGPILFKQIPYNMGKFATMEVVLENALKFTNKKKADLSGGEATINKQKALPGETVTSRLVKMSGELGVRGLFTGLSTRLIMVGSITAGQFAIYGEIKKALGATGGTEISSA
ncbi:unnamed protein product [Tilletia controversa]|nr:unnamed protein product [Tilletia controversa]